MEEKHPFRIGNLVHAKKKHGLSYVIDKYSLYDQTFRVLNVWQSIIEGEYIIQVKDIDNGKIYEVFKKALEPAESNNQANIGLLKKL